MAYTTSQFGAQFGLRILDNLQSYLEASTGTALTAIDPALESFADFRTPTPIVLNFPALFVSSSNTTIEQSDDDSHLISEIELYIDVAIDGVDTYALQRSMLKYLLAVDRVIRSMTSTDLLGANWNTGGIVTEPIWEVTGHQFGVLRQADTIYRLDARIVLIVQLLER
jgi:hypothetical protein